MTLGLGCLHWGWVTLDRTPPRATVLGPLAAAQLGLWPGLGKAWRTARRGWRLFPLCLVDGFMLPAAQSPVITSWV